MNTNFNSNTDLDFLNIEDILIHIVTHKKLEDFSETKRKKVKLCKEHPDIEHL